MTIYQIVESTFNPDLDKYTTRMVLHTNDPILALNTLLVMNQTVEDEHIHHYISIRDQFGQISSCMYELVSEYCHTAHIDAYNYNNLSW